MATKRTSDTMMENVISLAFCTAILAAVLFPVIFIVVPNFIAEHLN